MKILLIESDKAYAAGFVQFFQKNGFEVVHVGSGANILEVFEGNCFDAVVSELRLSGQSGFSVISSIRRTPRGMMVPILIVTDFGWHQNFYHAYTSGANFVLSKPVSHQQLFLIINNLLVQQQHKMEHVLRRGRDDGAMPE
jgi:DNA-binding response OmpR family regulator